MWTSGSSDCGFIPFLRIWKYCKRAELCFRATSMPPDAVARLAFTQSIHCRVTSRIRAAY